MFEDPLPTSTRLGGDIVKDGCGSRVLVVHRLKRSRKDLRSRVSNKGLSVELVRGRVEGSEILEGLNMGFSSQVWWGEHGQVPKVPKPT